MWTSQEFYSHFHLFLVSFASYLAVWLIRIVNEEFGTRPWVRLFKEILFKNCFKGWILIAISLVTLISLIIFPGKVTFKLKALILWGLSRLFPMKILSWIPQTLSYLRQLVLWCWLRFRMGCFMFECKNFISNTQSDFKNLLKKSNSNFS